MSPHFQKQQWVSENSGYFRDSFREILNCFMYAVLNLTENTLIQTITACIQKGSTIMSDKWKTYDGISHLDGYNFQHYIVNHSENFVDPITGAHTQNIENLWACSKKRNMRESGTAWLMLDSYLCEFLWRNRHKNEHLFNIILKYISESYPVK